MNIRIRGVQIHESRYEVSAVSWDERTVSVRFADGKWFRFAAYLFREVCEQTMLEPKPEGSLR